DVLAGNSYLYAGEKNITPWAVHLLSLSSYEQGAYRLINGSQQLANELQKKLIDNGGVVEKNSAVISCNLVNKLVMSVSTKHKEFFAEHFISSIHPHKLLELLPQRSFRKMYTQRVEAIPNMPSFFGLYLDLKP